MSRSKLDPLGITARLVLRELVRRTRLARCAKLLQLSTTLRTRCIKIDQISATLRTSPPAITRAIQKLTRLNHIVRSQPHGPHGSRYTLAVPPLAQADAWAIPPASEGEHISATAHEHQHTNEPTPAKPASHWSLRSLARPAPPLGFAYRFANEAPSETTDEKKPNQ